MREGKKLEMHENWILSYKKLNNYLFMCEYLWRELLSMANQTWHIIVVLYISIFLKLELLKSIYANKKKKFYQDIPMNSTDGRQSSSESDGKLEV